MSLERFEGPLFISMDTVQQLAHAYGLTLNAVELTTDELLALRYPMIAALDLTQDGQADHYVVVKDANETRVVYDESDGTQERLPTHEFLRLFTNFALVPAADSYGRLLSQAKVRSIRGGRSFKGKYPDLDDLFEEPEMGEDLKGLGLTIGATFLFQGLQFPTSWGNLGSFGVEGGWNYALPDLSGITPALMHTVATYQISNTMQSIAYDTQWENMSTLAAVTTGLNMGTTAALGGFSGFPGNLSNLPALERALVGLGGGALHGYVTNELVESGVDRGLASLVGFTSGYVAMSGLTNMFAPRPLVGGSFPFPESFAPSTAPEPFKSLASVGEGGLGAFSRNWDEFARQAIRIEIADLTSKHLGPEYAGALAHVGTRLVELAINWLAVDRGPTVPMRLPWDEALKTPSTLFPQSLGGGDGDIERFVDPFAGSQLQALDQSLTDPFDVVRLPQSMLTDAAGTKTYFSADGGISHIEQPFKDGTLVRFPSAMGDAVSVIQNDRFIGNLSRIDLSDVQFAMGSIGGPFSGGTGSFSRGSSNRRTAASWTSRSDEPHSQPASSPRTSVARSTSFATAN
ncbi:MAG: hypothetical protein HYW10_02765 [Candidatus Omnitrophica bacterium]|nr:hypothetical protein [Candidatus Omnitrophota bacterium]